MTKYYHTLPVEYFDAQMSEDEYIPYYSKIGCPATWLCKTKHESVLASQTEASNKVIMEIELDPNKVEDHSDMPICERTGFKYYIYRGNIPKKLITNLTYFKNPLSDDELRALWMEYVMESIK
jgi:hypothetical protein